MRAEALRIEEASSSRERCSPPPCSRADAGFRAWTRSSLDARRKRKEILVFERSHALPRRAERCWRSLWAQGSSPSSRNILLPGTRPSRPPTLTGDRKGFILALPSTQRQGANQRVLARSMDTADACSPSKNPMSGDLTARTLLTSERKRCCGCRTKNIELEAPAVHRGGSWPCWRSPPGLG